MAVYYNIQIRNQSGQRKHYAFFQQLPTLVTEGAPQVYANAWDAAGSTDHDSMVMVTYGGGISGFWAKAPRLEPSVVIEAAQTVPLDPTLREGVSFHGRRPSFSSPIRDLAQPGSVSITTGDDFTAADGYVLGLATDFGPIASFAAEPNKTYTLKANHKMFIVDGPYQYGQVLDLDALVRHAAVIDFTDGSRTRADVVQGPDGSYRVEYR